MGNFKNISLEGIKNYKVFDKSSFKRILNLDSLIEGFSFFYDGKEKEEIIFYDTPNNLLESAGIILSIVRNSKKALLKIELEKELVESSKSQRKVYTHDLNGSDDIEKNKYYIIDGITSFFSTNFSIDFDYIIKNLKPKIKVNIENNIIKILNGYAFKGQMNFYNVKINNTFKNKKAKTFLLKVEQTSTETNLKTFNDFIRELEKFCKEITPTTDSLFEISKVITR